MPPSQVLPRWFCLLTRQCLQTDATKYSLSIGFGILFGIILNVTHADHDFTALITLPGQLFLRALQCAVVPMMSVTSLSSLTISSQLLISLIIALSLSSPRLWLIRFFNITSSVAQIYNEGRVGSLGSKIFKFYMITTLSAVVNGITISNVYSSLFTSRNDEDSNGNL